MINVYPILKVFSQWCPDSIRQLSWLLGRPYETVRRLIKKLSSEEVRKAHATRVLWRWAGGRDLVVIAIDPTYTKGLEE